MLRVFISVQEDQTVPGNAEFAKPMFYTNDVSLAWQGNSPEESPSLKTCRLAAEKLTTEIRK